MRREGREKGVERGRVQKDEFTNFTPLKVHQVPHSRVHRVGYVPFTTPPHLTERLQTYICRGSSLWGLSHERYRSQEEPHPPLLVMIASERPRGSPDMGFVAKVSNSWLPRQYGE